LKLSIGCGRRLILADGIAYLNKIIKPDIIDRSVYPNWEVVCKLWAISRGLFTNNDDPCLKLTAAGIKWRFVAITIMFYEGV